MDETRSAWNETADKLGGLGLKLKLHYEQQQATDRAEAQTEMHGAMQRLGDAVQTAFEALGHAAKDDAVKDDVRQVGQSLTEALRMTFSEVSGEVRAALKNRSDDNPAETHESAPTPQESEVDPHHDPS